MVRIAGVDLPREKSVLYALPLIYGIGKHNAGQLIEKAGVDPRKKILPRKEGSSRKACT